MKNISPQSTQISNLNQNKETRRQFGGEYAYEQQSKSIPTFLIQLNMMRILNVTKSLRWIQT